MLSPSSSIAYRTFHSMPIAITSKIRTKLTPSVNHSIHQIQKHSRQYTSTTSSRSAQPSSPHPPPAGGAGCGNVQDQMLPASPDQTMRMYKHLTRPKTVSVIGCPMTLGQPYVGTDHGPKLLRHAGLLEDLTSIGWQVHDQGDLDCTSSSGEQEETDAFLGITNKSTSKNSNTSTQHDTSNAKNSKIVGKGCELLAIEVIKAIRKGHFPLILGGDHSIGAGSLAGLLKARPNTGIIWVDAHADLNTPEMSQSGNMHGMPVGLLMKGLMDSSSSTIPPGFEWLHSDEMRDVRLDPDSIVYIGLRDVDAKEREVLHKKNIKCFTMYDVDKDGIGGVMDKALHHLLHKDPDRPLHLSYDIDAVDPHIAQATGTPVRGGLTYREAHFVAEAAARCGNLASAEIVELNPTLSNDTGAAETVDLGLGLLTSLMGKSII